MEYEIEIYGMTDEDMFDIIELLVKSQIEGDDRHDIGIYLREGRPNSVFVTPLMVMRAVQLINGLGFQTGEDFSDS